LRGFYGSLVIGSSVLVMMTACGGTAPPPPPPAPAPAAVAIPAPEPPPLPATLQEARSALAGGHPDLYEKALLALSASQDAQTSSRATALLALAYIDQKRFDEALPLLAKAGADDPRIAPWMQLRIATIQHDSAHDPEAVAALENVIQTTPASSAATTARIRLPGMQALAGQGDAATATLTDALSIPLDALSEKKFLDLASDLDKADRGDLANRVRMRLLTDFPQGRDTEQTYGSLAGRPGSPLDTLSTDDALALAARLARSDHYDQVFDLLKRTVQHDPAAANSQRYQSIRLHSLFHSRRYDELLRATKSRRLRDPDLILLRAHAAWRAGKPKEFLSGLAHVEHVAPRSGEAVEAKILRALYYTNDQPKLKLAITNLSKAIRTGGSGAEGETLWTLGWTEFLAKDYDGALRTLAQYGREFPDGDYRTNALFWSGKIDQILGKTAARDSAFAELTRSYPYSYYSYRARQLLDQPLAAPSEVDNGNVFPNVDAELADVTEPRLDSVRELSWLGLERDATAEMQSIAAAYPDNSGMAFMLADLYADGGEPYKGSGVLFRRFRQFVRHGGSGVPHRFWEILFPLKYWDTIRTEAERRQIDPYLIASIIRQESGFEPSVVSNAGAVGIMQIMPNEAARIAAAAALPPPTREQLFDPKTNIEIGIAEFSQKLAVMHGTPMLAIAAYNAGEDVVGNWLAQTPVDDMDVFVESIPYAETRLYVKSVSRNRFEYRRIYEGASPETQ